MASAFGAKASMRAVGATLLTSSPRYPSMVLLKAASYCELYESIHICASWREENGRSGLSGLRNEARPVPLSSSYRSLMLSLRTPFFLNSSAAICRASWFARSFRSFCAAR